MYIAITNNAIITDSQGRAKLFTADNAPLNAETTLHMVKAHSTDGDTTLVHLIDSNHLIAAK